MTGNATRNKTIFRRGVAVALVAVALQFGAAVQSAEAADQIRLKLKNSAAFTVDRIDMWTKKACSPDGDCVKTVRLDRTRQNTAIGQTRNVKYNIGDDNWETIKGVWFDFTIGNSDAEGTCIHKTVGLQLSGDQITRLSLPNGNVYTDKLDSDKDQVILVVFEIKGTSEDNKCIFKRVASVKNR